MRLLKRLTWRVGFLRVSRKMVRTGRPPETGATFRRLRSEGHSSFRAYQLVAAAYEAEVAAMILEQRVYQHGKYVEQLNALPRAPTWSLNMVPARGPA